MEHCTGLNFHNILFQNELVLNGYEIKLMMLFNGQNEPIVDKEVVFQSTQSMEKIKSIKTEKTPHDHIIYNGIFSLTKYSKNSFILINYTPVIWDTICLCSRRNINNHIQTKLIHLVEDIVVNTTSENPSALCTTSENSKAESAMHQFKRHSGHRSAILCEQLVDRESLMDCLYMRPINKKHMIQKTTSTFLNPLVLSRILKPQPSEFIKPHPSVIMGHFVDDVYAFQAL
jgi:hypothetical protein